MHRERDRPVSPSEMGAGEGDCEGDACVEAAIFLAAFRLGCCQRDPDLLAGVAARFSAYA